MNPWTCALLIAIAGGIGGVINALLTDNGFMLPQKKSDILCPGFVSNVLIGATAALVSWAFYGSGASIELANSSERAEISLRLTALAGAFLVGLAGAKWLTNEADKLLLRESVRIAGEKKQPIEDCAKIITASPRKILDAVQKA